MRNENLEAETGYAYAAIHPDGGRNVHVTGANCRNCDDTYDPHHRTGVPCQWARAHAWHTIDSWGVGHVQRIPIGDLPDELRPGCEGANTDG